MTNIVLDFPILGLGAVQVQTPSTQGEWSWEQSLVSGGWFAVHGGHNDWFWTLGATATGTIEAAMVKPGTGRVSLRGSPATGWATSLRGDGWEILGGQGLVRADLHYPQADQVGSLEVKAEGMMLRWPLGGLGLLHLRGEVQSLYHVLSLVPYASKGDWEVTSLVSWGTILGGAPPWGWKLFAAANVNWSSQGTLRTYREWLEWVPWFPFLGTATEEVHYNLAWDPSWLIVLKPQVTWVWSPGWTLEVARWVVFTGGWDILTEWVSGTPKDTLIDPSSFSQDTWRRWWLDGLELAVRTTF